MAILFAKLGMLTAEAATLQEALRQLAESFDIICLDLMLPDGNDVEVLRRVRDRNLNSKVAVISGADEPSMLAEVTRLRPDAIFGKPLDIEDFNDWLKSQGIPVAGE